MGLDVNIFIKKDILFVRFKGELDENHISSLREKVSGYIDSYQINHLVLNMKDLSFIDSSGIGFIIGRYHQLKKKNGDITLCNLNSKVEKIVRVSGLLRICKIRDTEESTLLFMEVQYERN